MNTLPSYSPLQQASIPRGWLKEVNPFGQPIYINVKTKEKVGGALAGSRAALVWGFGVGGGVGLTYVRKSEGLL